MQIRRLLQFFLLGTLLFSAAIAGMAIMLLEIESKGVEAQNKRHQSYMLANELRQSSDNLTRFARMFVATNEEKYLRYFQDILDIRNGKISRPESYEGVYWDLVVGKIIPEPVRDKTNSLSLEARLLKAGISINEFNKLKEAENISNELARLETVAFNAIKGRADDGTGLFLKEIKADSVFANKILNDERYNNYKSRIMQPISEFLMLVDNRTKLELIDLNKQSKNLVIMITSLSGSLFAFLTILVWILFARFLKRSSYLMQTVKKISEGDFSTRTKISGTDELGVLSAAIDSMANNIEISIIQANQRTLEANKQTEELIEERHKSDQLLKSILPPLIANRLRNGESMIAETFPEVTVLFADIVGFTELSARIGPREIVSMLNDIFKLFDKLTVEIKIEKIKTIGDCYMVVGGLPERDPLHCQKIANFALDAQQSFAEYAKDFTQPLSIRMGMHSGTVVAGVVGTQKFSYDLWGDVVNVASRYESTGKPNKIHLSDSVKFRLDDDFIFEQAEDVDLKGKGKSHSWFLIGRKHKT